MATPGDNGCEKGCCTQFNLVKGVTIGDGGGCGQDGHAPSRFKTV